MHPPHRSPAPAIPPGTTTAAAGIRRFSTVALLVTAIAIAAAAEPRLPQPVHTASGLVTGVADETGAVVSFKGVPYAAPPVGDLRWRPPQPPAPWNGIRCADRFGASCPQPRSPSGALRTNTSEDCLFLNIWTPAVTARDRLPVLFFVHGGAWSFGSGDLRGEDLARKGVIVVTVNYRLGIFCGMGHPELTAESPERTCGNYGELDLIAALQWVRANIAGFGGDPSRVTIAGQSSGAHAVHYLTASPRAVGLFSGVIAMSFSYSYLTRPNVVGGVRQKEEFGLKFAAGKRVHGLAELRALSAAQLLSDDPEVDARTRAVLGGGVNTDGQAFPLQYPQALERGLFSDVPTMTGFTADEFTPPARHLTTTVASFPAAAAGVFKDYGAAFAGIREDYLAQFAVTTDQEARDALKLATVEGMMTSTFAWAKRRARTARSPVYTYLFAHQATEERGAPHGADLAYAFANPQAAWNDDDRAVADLLSSYWVDFIATGDPNGGRLPAWAPFAASRPMTMGLDVIAVPRAIADPLRLRFYQELQDR